MADATTAAQTDTASAPAREPAPPVTDAEDKVSRLRKIAKTDPGVAQREAWAWFKGLGKLAGSDRAAADAQLDELFRLGKPARGVDGPTDGILVTPLIQPLADRALRLITSAWMPWQGKRFDEKARRGDNRLVGSARLPAKLLWPRYTTEEVADGRIAFRFNTWVEPGKVDPDREVLVIDYGSVEDNPGLLIKKIRDELVEICLDTYLGKILYRTGEDSYTNLGFFALRVPR
jgi:hypothetical protein